MSRLSTTIFSSVIALSLAAVGCAAASDPSADDQTEASQDELAVNAARSVLAGKYYDRSVPFGGIGRLTLTRDGKYTAHMEAGERAICLTSPCLIPESGTWTATKLASGSYRLRLLVGGDAARVYTASKDNNSGELNVTIGGKTQHLTSLDANGCLDDGDCSATEECGPKLCLMYCLAGDPFCCGPSTCQPKAPAPKRCGGFAGLQCASDEECIDDPTDSCDPSHGGADCGGICQKKPTPPPPQAACNGAWVDQNGTCRAPNDGVYPADCCGGPKCGEAQCSTGQVCCNPLHGICTAPGEVCAF
jgi:hypothetical protein